MTVPAFAANLDLTPLHQGLQFNFSFPGARSLGMGGAFIGRADDASAAETNPAGLTALVSPEFTLEVRQLDYSEDVPFGAGALTASNGVLRVSNRHVTPSFLSVVYPTGRISFAAFYSRPLDYQQSASIDVPTGVVGTSSQPIPGCSTPPCTFLFGDFPSVSSLHYVSETLGLSAAWKMQGLSIGVGIRDQRVRTAASIQNTGISFVNGVFVKDPTKGTSFGRIEGTQSKLAYTVGLKWATASEALSVGAVYKSGANYSLTECNPLSAGGGCSDPLSNPGPSSFEVPPQFGAGISVRPMRGVTVNADVLRIQYDRLLQHFSPFEFCASECSAQSFGFAINNATEIHIGGEWALVSMNVPIALRAGWWHDPDHSLRYGGPINATGPLVQAEQSFAALRFPGQGSHNHVAFGIGYIRPAFEINAGYDHSSLTKTASVSALKRF